MTDFGDLKIFVIDDDAAVCRGISLLLRSAGKEVECFPDLSEFLLYTDHPGPGCILLDVFFGERSALEMQSEISTRFPHLPIIFITALGDIPMSVRALKKGAINFLQKPFGEEELFEAIGEALSRSTKLLQDIHNKNQVRNKMELLTPREYEVFSHLITGMPYKQIAARMNIAEHTVKLHRGKIAEKLRVKTVAEMVQLAGRLNSR